MVFIIIARKMKVCNTNYSEKYKIIKKYMKKRKNKNDTSYFELAKIIRQDKKRLALSKSLQITEGVFIWLYSYMIQIIT